jgi:hypothetical protein
MRNDLKPTMSRGVRSINFDKIARSPSVSMGVVSSERERLLLACSLDEAQPFAQGASNKCMKANQGEEVSSRGTFPPKAGPQRLSSLPHPGIPFVSGNRLNELLLFTRFKQKSETPNGQRVISPCHILGLKKPRQRKDRHQFSCSIAKSSLCSIETSRYTAHGTSLCRRYDTFIFGAIIIDCVLAPKLPLA